MNCLSQSALILRKVVFLLAFVLLLLLTAKSAQAQSDPCTAAGTVNGTKGCGALITVYTVDANGNATSFAVTPVGLSYDSEKDDWLVGILNNSTGPLKSIALSTPGTSTTGVFAFDLDGPCAFNHADCFGSFFSTGYTYRGPDNTFTTSGSGTTGTVNFTTAIPAIGCAPQFCNSTWFALEGLPVTNVTQQVNPVSTGGGSSTVTNNFNLTTGSTVVQEIEFPSNNSNPNGSDHLATTNFPLSASTWPQYVVGTPWATSQCAAHLGNGGGGNLCSLYVNACWNSSTQSLATASDAFCPSVINAALGVVTIKDTFDWPKPTITHGTTVSLISFSPPLSTPYLQWTPSSGNQNPVCTIFLSPATPCYIADRLTEMYGDQTTTRGTYPKTKSWNITAFNVAMLLTSVFAAPNSSAVIPSGTAACPLTANAALNNPNPASATFESPTFTTGPGLWFNGNCFIDFVVNPAQAPPVPNNNFVAAIPAALAYGSPAIPNPDTPLSNTASASPWDTLSQLNGQTLGSLAGGDGAGKIIQWSAIDAAGITEKNIQLNNTGTCPNPDTGVPDSAPCYTTNLFTTQVNLDSVAPTASITFSQPGTVFYVGEQVTATAACIDALSGIASCVSNFTSGGNLNTSAAGGPFTLTTKATDKAGNTGSASASYTVGDFSIGVTPSSQTISSGQQGPLFTITITPLGGLTGSVGLSCATTPIITGLTCSVTPNIDNLAGKPISSTVTLSASKNTTHQTYTVTFTGKYPAGGPTVLSHSANATLTVKGNNN